MTPSRASRASRESGRDPCTRRNLAERSFGKIKEFRRVATRYGKRAGSHLSTVLLAETRYLPRTPARRTIESTRQACCTGG